MTGQQKLIYGAFVGVVVFFLGEFVFGAGTLAINLVFGLAMGLFAVLAVTVAARLAGRDKE